jgi:hypothetical protein
MSFAKIFWEETEKQKTRSCRAQEFPRSCAQWKGWNGGEGGNESNLVFGKAGKKSRMSARFLIACWWTAKEQRTVALHRWDGFATPANGTASYVSRIVEKGLRE